MANILYVDDSGASHAASFVLQFFGASAKIITTNEDIRKTEEFKTASPKGELPVFVNAHSKASAGLFEAIKAIASQSENPSFLGAETTKKEEDKYLLFIAKELIPSVTTKDNRYVGRLHKINNDLLLSVFLFGNRMTVVDLVLFSIFYPIVKSWKENERVTFMNITRWVDFIQHQDGISASNYPIFDIKKNVTSAPIPIRKDTEKVPAKEKVEEKPKETKAQQPVVENKDKAKETPKEKKSEDKEEVKHQEKKSEEKEDKQEKPSSDKTDERKEKNKQKTAAKQSTPKPAIDVSRLKILVGKIVKVKKHESADTLYVEEIDVGEAKPRVVVSGLVNFVPIEEMQNREVVVVCNLKPSNLKGVKSEAMVLAASNSDHTQVELLIPPPGTKVGERVTFDGYSGEPEEQLNPKHKIWEAIQPDFITSDDCVATYKGTPFKTSTGVCKVKSIKKGSIK